MRLVLKDIIEKGTWLYTASGDLRLQWMIPIPFLSAYVFFNVSFILAVASGGQGYFIPYLHAPAKFILQTLVQ